MLRKLKILETRKNVAPGQYQFFEFLHQIPISYLKISSGNICISNVKILNDFDNYFGQLNCLENEKNEKGKKRRAGTISIF